jgi:DNA-directed RNA polymerase subunit E'/Rpb7
MASLSHNFDYHENIRAKIIARNSKSIESIDDLKRLMQFNDWYQNKINFLLKKNST